MHRAHGLAILRIRSGHARHPDPVGGAEPVAGACRQGGRDMRIDTSRAALASFKKVAADPIFTVKLS